MGKRRKAADIAALMETLRTELIQLDELEEPTDDQVARATVALEEFEALSTEHTEAVDYERRLEAVRSSVAVESTTEPARPATRGGGAPGVIIRTDPYDGLETIRANRYDAADVIERARYAVDQAPKHMNDAARANVERLIAFDDEDDSRQAPLIARHILLTGSPEYHRQFKEYMRTGFPGEALRASLSLTDANGGYLVPFTLDPTVILTNAGIIDPIRGLATVKTIATDAWNGVTSAGMTAGWTAEGSEATDSPATFAQPTITPKRADAWIDGTYEVLADSGFASELGRLLADAKGRLEGAAFATGNTGATQPRGIVAATAAVTTSIVASATTNAFVIADVYSVSDGLRARDASQASWIANKKIYSKIRQFDTTGSAAFWANLGMGRPQNLIGQPVYECSSMQSAITTAGLVLLAGNFAEYCIVDRVGMSVQYNPMLMGLTTGRPTGKAGWLAFWRVGADVLDVGAFRVLQLNQVAANVALA